MTEPIEDKINEFELNKFLSTITTTNVKQFLIDDVKKEDLIKYSFNKPLLKLEIALQKEGTPVELSFASYNNEMFVFNSQDGFIAKIDSDIFVKLDVDFQDLRNNELFSFNKWEVSKIEVLFEDILTRSFKEGDNKWVTSQELRNQNLEANKTDIDVSVSEITDFLDLLGTEKIESFVYNGRNPDLKMYGLHKPRYSIACIIIMYEGR